jgi:pimeloyl-ACP methyl ester carboxylesterase
MDDLWRHAVPTSAVFGENDPLVPVAASLEAYRRTAVRAERLQRTIVFPDADHRIQTGDGFASGYRSTISQWCHKSLN